MALEAGDAVLGTGLAGVIAGARKEAYGPKYSLKMDAKAINLEAAAIIAYFVVNTEVEVPDVTIGRDTVPGTIS